MAGGLDDREVARRVVLGMLAGMATAERVRLAAGRAPLEWLPPAERERWAEWIVEALEGAGALR